MRILVRYVTGHAHLRRHDKLLGTLDFQPTYGPKPQYFLKDPDELFSGPYDEEVTCRLCQLPGREETPWHIFTECPKVCGLRSDHFGHRLLPNGLTSWEPANLARFFAHIDLENRVP